MKRRIAVCFMVIVLLLGLMCGCDLSKQESVYTDYSKIGGDSDSFSYSYCNGGTENTELSMTFEGFSGYDTLWIIDAKEKGTLTVDFESKIDSGKFKVVLVTPNREVKNLFEQSQKDSVTIDIEKGRYRIKIVGHKSKGEVTGAIKTNGDMEITEAEAFGNW